jgi:hypothetical protein
MSMKSRKQPEMVRTTIFLPVAMDMNLSALALMTGESRSTLIRLALTQYMKEKGYDAHKKPRVTIHR